MAKKDILRLLTITGTFYQKCEHMYIMVSINRITLLTEEELPSAKYQNSRALGGAR